MEGKEVAHASLDWEKHPQAREVMAHYRWVVAHNRRYDIYLGEGAMMSMAVVVVDRQKTEDRVVWVRRLSALDRLRNMLGL